MILQAWLTLPSCLASSSRPTLARITLRSVVIVWLLDKEANRKGGSPSPARDSKPIGPGLSDQILANTDHVRRLPLANRGPFPVMDPSQCSLNGSPPRIKPTHEARCCG